MNKQLSPNTLPSKTFRSGRSHLSVLMLSTLLHSFSYDDAKMAWMLRRGSMSNMIKDVIGSAKEFMFSPLSVWWLVGLSTTNYIQTTKQISKKPGWRMGLSPEQTQYILMWIQIKDRIKTMFSHFLEHWKIGFFFVRFFCISYWNSALGFPPSLLWTNPLALLYLYWRFMLSPDPHPLHAHHDLSIGC